MINHPLQIGQSVIAHQPTCPCTGSSYKQITGKIQKVISNHSGIWYYLDIGITIRSTTIQSVIN